MIRKLRSVNSHAHCVRERWSASGRVRCNSARSVAPASRYRQIATNTTTRPYDRAPISRRSSSPARVSAASASDTLSGFLSEFLDRDRAERQAVRDGTSGTSAPSSADAFHLRQRRNDLFIGQLVQRLDRDLARCNARAEVLEVRRFLSRQSNRAKLFVRMSWRARPAAAACRHTIHESGHESCWRLFPIAVGKRWSAPLHRSGFQPMMAIPCSCLLFRSLLTSPDRLSSNARRLCV